MLQFAELAARAHVVEAHEREGQGRSSPNCTQKGVPVVAARKRAGAGGDFVAQHEHLFVVLVERIEERRRLRQVAKVIACQRLNVTDGGHRSPLVRFDDLVGGCGRRGHLNGRLGGRPRVLGDPLGILGGRVGAEEGGCRGIPPRSDRFGSSPGNYLEQTGVEQYGKKPEILVRWSDRRPAPCTVARPHHAAASTRLDRRLVPRTAPHRRRLPAGWLEVTHRAPAVVPGPRPSAPLRLICEPSFEMAVRD
mmetsp:Transcript_6399/g.18956  ORF Transcript_6399/g.18956 Transcript_6399/m.18956 type:complete len:250 (-) Transcript_6399:161-910(-)